MIKKTFLIIFLLSFFILPKLSFAEALLTSFSLEATSVTLRAENLTPNTVVTLGVVNKNSGAPRYSEYFKTTSDNIGKASIDFINLSPGEAYVGSAYYENSNIIVGTTTFSTKTGMVVTMKPPEETSVVFMLSNFPKNKEISFNVENFDYQTPKYTNPQDVMTDESGLALLEFYGLSPGKKYKYTHSEEPGRSGSFWTKDPLNPTPEGDTGDTNFGTGSSDPGGLVPCGTTRNPAMCGFNDLMALINKVINFILFVMAVPIAAIMFAYAGFMLVTSGGSSEKMSKAKSTFINVAIGLIIVAASWLMVHTVLNIVGYDGSWIGL